ncbi:unnamed protein product [Triticum turgidum subsp. durum]|uniref:Uncharacterized protein n=1 Tax=Triticum turgidum subsp. durum TaxID=4567 RepID=A0A9R1NRF7_TRITD|nr:unnamed protein product [Triticum turgidum subsp. durum]
MASRPTRSPARSSTRSPPTTPSCLLSSAQVPQDGGEARQRLRGDHHQRQADAGVWHSPVPHHQHHQEQGCFDLYKLLLLLQVDKEALMADAALQSALHFLNKIATVMCVILQLHASTRAKGSVKQVSW